MAIQCMEFATFGPFMTRKHDWKVNNPMGWSWSIEKRRRSKLFKLSCNSCYGVSHILYNLVTDLYPRPLRRWRPQCFFKDRLTRFQHSPSSPTAMPPRFRAMSRRRIRLLAPGMVGCENCSGRWLHLRNTDWVLGTRWRYNC
jgi:hypothetical protein